MRNLFYHLRSLPHSGMHRALYAELEIAHVAFNGSPCAGFIAGNGIGENQVESKISLHSRQLRDIEAGNKKGMPENMQKFVMAMNSPIIEESCKLKAG